MGTRADFYIGRGKDARWLGSIAYDGYPEALLEQGLKNASDEAAFLARVAGILERDDATKPEQGWPWPWQDSRTTDYAYAYDEGQVWTSHFGREWMTVAEALDADREDSDEEVAAFPDMTDRQKVTYGPRSGVLVFR
jgi:hypothetical protein